LPPTLSASVIRRRSNPITRCCSAMVSPRARARQEK
jgi:hypothetical protein